MCRTPLMSRPRRFGPGTLHHPLCSRLSWASWSSASPPIHFGAGGRVCLRRDAGLRSWQPGDTHVPVGAPPLLLSHAGLSMAVIPTALSVLGFTSTGIAAGSMAARMMSLAAMANGGRVAAGSLVAIAQSLGECSQCIATGCPRGHCSAPRVLVSLGGTSSVVRAWGGHGSGDPQGPHLLGCPVWPRWPGCGDALMAAGR